MSPRPSTWSILASRLAAASIALGCAVAGCIPDELDLAADAAAPKADGALDAPREAEAEVGTAQDCRDVCNDTCMGANPSTECDKCVVLTCEQPNKRVDTAPNVQALDDCSFPCKDYACYQGCCKGREQACDAYRLVDSCACGAYLYNCKPKCADLCAGKPPAVDCEECLKDTACGLAWYDWRYHSTTADYLLCAACPDAGCSQSCCVSYPASCALFDALKKCACTSSG